jgi:hypothetical protein
VFGRKRIDNEISFEPKYVEIFSGLHHWEPDGKKSG